MMTNKPRSRKKCELCGRYTTQQDWKTDAEKRQCFTCRSTVGGLKVALEAYQTMLGSMDIPLRIVCELGEKTAEERLLSAVYGKVPVLYLRKNGELKEYV